MRYCGNSSVLADVFFTKQELGAEIVRYDWMVVDDSQRANAGEDKIFGDLIAKTSYVDEQDVRFSNPFLGIKTP